MMKTLKELLAEANSQIEEIKASEAVNLMGDSNVVFVDVREQEELTAEGKIPDAIHASRGMLEFYLDPEMPYYNKAFSEPKQFIFYCKVGLRSALAAKVAQDMGIKNVKNMIDGFAAWQQLGAEIDMTNTSVVK